MKWKGALGFIRAKGFFLLMALCLILIAGAAVYARTRLIAAPVPESGRASARLAAAEAATSWPTSTPAPAPSPTPQPLSWPISGREILRAETIEPVWVEALGVYETHPGVDIRAEAGEDVLAASEGSVASARYDPRWGYMVEVQSVDGLAARYGNLEESIPVSPGDRVRRGQVVGMVGVSAPSAKVLGSFLHFEAFRGDASVALP